MILKERLYNYIKERHPKKIAKGEIQRWVALETSYTPENAGRRLRELENSGRIFVTYEKNHAFYELGEPPKVETYQVIGNRTQQEIKL